MRRFSLTVEQMTPKVFRVGLGGELDHATTYTVDEELRAIERRRPETIVIDLRELRFLDSSGLARLLSAQRRAQRGGWRLAIVRGPRNVQKILQLAALDRTLDLIDEPRQVLVLQPQPASI